MKKYYTQARTEISYTQFKKKKGQMDWSHLAQEVPSKTRY